MYTTLIGIRGPRSNWILLSAVFLTSVQKKCLCWRGLAGRDSAVRAALCVAPPVLIPPRVAPLCWGTPWAPARPGLGVRARSGHVRGGCEACALWGADTPVGTVRWIRVESHLRGRTRYHHTLALAWRLSPEPSRARVWQDSDRATPSTGERSREGGSRSLLACLRRYLDATSSTAQGEPQRPHLLRPAAHVLTYSPLVRPGSGLIGASLTHELTPPRPLAQAVGSTCA